MAIKRFVGQVVFEIDGEFDDAVYELEDAEIVGYLLNQDVKVKSGELENQLYGTITGLSRQED